MNQFILFSALTVFFLSNSGCNKNKTNPVRYKGKLEIAGICMNYTIRAVEGNIDSSLVAANWIDDVTNNSYTNVFRLGNSCDFPTTIKEGDEFYFSIYSGKEKECVVCLAYYPTPPKSLSIKVVN